MAKTKIAWKRMRKQHSLETQEVYGIAKKKCKQAYSQPNKGTGICLEMTRWEITKKLLQVHNRMISLLGGTEIFKDKADDILRTLFLNNQNLSFVASLELGYR
jgi:hypothetical protein